MIKQLGDQTMRKWFDPWMLIVICVGAVLCCVTFILAFPWAPYALMGRQQFKALDAARPTAPYLPDFLRLFPHAAVNYRYFTHTGEPGFDVEVDMYERYEFAMQLPVRFDSEGRKVIGYGEPKFYLVEASSQKGRETFYNPAGERQFGSAEWRKIVDSGGDFLAIGYSMITNQPVAGFRDRKAQP